MCEFRVILSGEIGCESLLGVKELTIDYYSFLNCHQNMQLHTNKKDREHETQANEIV